MKHAGIIIIGAAIGAYLLFAPKSNDGGSGGSLNIPNLGDMLGSGSTQNPAQDNSFQISDKIMAAMSADKKATVSQTPVGNGGGYVSSGLMNTAEPTLSSGFGGYKSYGTPSILEFTTASQAVGITKKASTPSQNYSSQGGGNYSGGWGAVAKRR